MSSQPEIRVNGRSYPLVRLDELTLDEAIVMWEYTKMGLDQIPNLEGFHPGVTAGLIHVSVARGEPNESGASIRRVVGKIPLADLESVFGDISEEVEANVPPPVAPAASSPNAGSGADSSSTGEPAPAPSRANGSGSPGSATGATSALPISVP